MDARGSSLLKPLSSVEYFERHGGSNTLFLHSDRVSMLAPLEPLDFEAERRRRKKRVEDFVILRTSGVLPNDQRKESPAVKPIILASDRHFLYLERKNSTKGLSSREEQRDSASDFALSVPCRSQDENKERNNTNGCNKSCRKVSRDASLQTREENLCRVEKIYASSSQKHMSNGARCVRDRRRRGESSMSQSSHTQVSSLDLKSFGKRTNAPAREKSLEYRSKFSQRKALLDTSKQDKRRRRSAASRREGKNLIKEDEWASDENGSSGERSCMKGRSSPVRRNDANNEDNNSSSDGHNEREEEGSISDDLVEFDDSPTSSRPQNESVPVAITQPPALTLQLSSNQNTTTRTYSMRRASRAKTRSGNRTSSCAGNYVGVRAKRLNKLKKRCSTKEVAGASSATASSPSFTPIPRASNQRFTQRKIDGMFRRTKKK